MKKGGHRQSCKIGGGEGRVAGKEVELRRRTVDKEALNAVYNRYYKNQVTALFRAVRGD